MNTFRMPFFHSLILLVLAMLPGMSVAALPPHVEGEVLVTFKSTASAAVMAASQAGIATMKQIGGGVYDIRLQADETVESMLQQLQNNPLVASVQPNYIKTLLTTDPDYSQQWGLKNTGQAGGQPGADIHIEDAWTVTRGDPSNPGDPRVIVAVLDTGVDTAHRDLVNQLWQNPGEIPDGTDNDGNGIVDDIIGADFSDLNLINGNPVDLNGHGTEVAGVIGAEADNGIGVSGVAPGVSLMIVKAFSGGVSTTANIVAGIDYAIQHGADIINASYGHSGVRYPGSGFDYAEYSAIQRAEIAGILFVAGAGNGCNNSDSTQSNYDPNCPYITTRGYDNDHPPQNMDAFVPASYDLPNIIAVAATDRNDDLAYFSNYGANSVDLAAPGQAIYTTNLGDVYGFASGTSLAAPFVSGTLALMESTGDTSAYSLKSRLLASVDGIAALSGKVASGGRLNAATALAAQPVTAPSGGGGGGGLAWSSVLVLVAWRRRKG